MKILMVSGFFKPSWESGGVTRVSYELATQLLHLGNDVTVYTTNMSVKDYNVPLNKKTLVDGIDVFYFDNLRRIFRMKFVSFPYYAPFIIRKHIKEFDVVHIHEYRSFLNLCVAYYARKNHIPYVIQAHGSMPLVILGHNPLILFLKKIFDKTLGEKILENASGFIAVSEAEIKPYEEYNIPKSKISVIYNGLSAEKNSSTHENKIETSNKVILYLGRLDQRKGIDYLIKAFSQLTLTTPLVRLSICGTGDRSYSNKLVQLTKDLNIEDKVDFRGYVSDKMSAYIDADVLVYPSVGEIFGIVPFEALLCGTPVIVTDDCGCGEIINRIGCGNLVKYGDDMGLAKMINYVLTHPDTCQKQVEIGIKYILDNLSWSKIVLDYINAYNQILIE